MEIHIFDAALECFIQGLERRALVKVLRTIDLLEEFEYRLGMPHSKKVLPQLFELRIQGQPEVRILYTFRRNSIVLLHGFIKKSQRLPQKELLLAQRKLLALDSI